jgi:hypothetical protein
MNGRCSAAGIPDGTIALVIRASTASHPGDQACIAPTAGRPATASLDRNGLADHLSSLTSSASYKILPASQHDLTQHGWFPEKDSERSRRR